MEELQQMCNRTRLLRRLLQLAEEHNQHQKVKQYSYELTANNALIVDYLMDYFERSKHHSDANSGDSVGSAVGVNVNVSDNAPIYLYRPDRIDDK